VYYDFLHSLLCDHIQPAYSLFFVFVGVTPAAEAGAHPVLVVGVLDYGGFKSVHFFLPDLKLPGPEHFVETHAGQEVPVLDEGRPLFFLFRVVLDPARKISI